MEGRKKGRKGGRIVQNGKDLKNEEKKNSRK